MFRSIKSKLLFSFAVFFSITTVWVGAALWLDIKKSKIENLKSLLLRTRILFAEAVRLEKDFFMFEPINPDFFKCNESRYLQRRDDAIDLIKKNLQGLKNDPEIKNLNISENADSLTANIDRYEIIFDSLVKLTLMRGFKNYGYEGEMREAIHNIENYRANLIDKNVLLSVRRNEKDYLLRKDLQYIKQVDDLLDDITPKLLSKKDTSALAALNEINRYSFFLKKIVETEAKIGYSEQSGLRGELAKTGLKIEAHYEQINDKVFLFAENFEAKIKNLMIFVSVLSIILMSGLSLYSVKKLSAPVSKLSESIKKAVEDNFKSEKIDIYLAGNDEIAMLSRDFDLMYNKVRISLEYISNQAQELQESQDHIMDSLRYAQTIQEAVLPNSSVLNSYFADSFVFYQPQNVVSGDFYWIYRKRQKTFFAVADCTGHGVPGAFMSLIGNMLLTKIIELARIYDPALMLETLHLELRTVLQQDKAKNDDGMDIALCSFENTEEGVKMIFAGAKRSMMILQDGEIQKIRGNKRSVGGKQKTFFSDFENKEILLKKGDLLYFYTDGFYDQNNEKREKYGSERFEYFIRKTAEKPLEQQKELFQTEFERFKGDQKQRDDVTVIALKI
jgi:serine phosphatase RsbU (regulator of sigma subunit)